MADIITPHEQSLYSPRSISLLQSSNNTEVLVIRYNYSLDVCVQVFIPSLIVSKDVETL